MPINTSEDGCIYLLRHGETVWNRERRVQGTLDSPLTWQGCQQARRLAERLAMDLRSQGLDPEELQYQVSPLGRTLQTAALVGEVLGVGFAHWQRQPLIRELAWGEWEGLNHAQMEARAPGAMAERERDRWWHRPPGGETYAEGFERAGKWLASLPASVKLVVVSHGGFGRLLRGRYGGLARADMIPLDAPQDALFCLQGGQIRRLEVADLS